MARNTPFIQQQLLFLPPLSEPVCVVGSPAWFNWLHTAASFRFCSTQHVDRVRGCGARLAALSLRKEGRRRGQFWYAYRRASRQLYKRYVGRSEQLTLDKLDELARLLHFCEDP